MTIPYIFVVNVIKKENNTNKIIIRTKDTFTEKPNRIQLLSSSLAIANTIKQIIGICLL